MSSEFISLESIRVESPTQPPGASFSRRPRILFFSPYWPHKATSAGELRALHIARALRRLGEVDVALVDEEGGGEEWERVPEKEFAIPFKAPVRSRPNRSLGQKLRWVFDPRMDYPHGRGVDPKDRDRAMQIARDYDLLWFYKLPTANAFPQGQWPRSVLDIDDVPSLFQHSVVRERGNLCKRLLAAKALYSWRRREKLLAERFSVLAVCSQADKHYLQNLGVDAPLHVVPNGFEGPKAVPKRSLASPPRIGFIGIFDYRPNIEGIRWFVRHCWPRIKRAVPDARLRLVGRHSDGPLKPAGPDIDARGWVEDPADEIATWSAMIVPIRIGAGTRGKIAHAFSSKCPVVSTPVGAHGYDPEDGREMFLGNTAQEFADACIRAIREPEEAARMAERAWEEFLEKWTWEAIAPRVLEAAEDCLRRNREQPAEGGAPGLS